MIGQFPVGVQFIEPALGLINQAPTSLNMQKHRSLHMKMEKEG